MDTKERKRRRPARTPEEAAARRQRTTQQRAQTGAPQQEAPRSQSARRQASGTGTIDRSRAASTQTRAPRQRTVKRPEPEHIPEVTYSMPKPFSRGRFMLKLITVVAVVLAVMSCLSLFFQVDQVLVSGAEQYTPYAIKMASGIEEGDPLLQISEPRTAGKIIDALPYIKSVKISRNLPGTVSIQVQELEVTYAIQAIDESWWLIASDGRVVEQIDASQASAYTKIVGVLAEAPRTNQQIQAAQMTEPESETVPGETSEGETTVAETETTEPATEETGETSEQESEEVSLPPQPREGDQERMNTVLAILDQLERNEVIGQMSVIDVTSLTGITMEYGNRFHVVVGTTEELGYKIAAMTSAVAQLQEYEIGELDVSFKFGDKVIFNPANA